MPYAIDAAERIRKESAEPINGENALYVNAVKSAVENALIEFCAQNEEFAQAVVQSSKSFGDCLKEICKGIGGSCSDFEVYSKAADFYFPGAQIEFEMKIHMSEHETGKKCEIIQLDLSSLI